MDLSELDFSFPESLIATERAPHSRAVLVKNGEPVEMSPRGILGHIQPEDTLVINTSKVIPARVFAQNNSGDPDDSSKSIEILFIQSLDTPQDWQVLCPARSWPEGQALSLAGGVTVELVQRGRPQHVRTSRPIDLSYFREHGDIPLPPYIQKARGLRKSNEADYKDYQSDWATEWGSLAAPTASFHFSSGDLEGLKNRGVGVVPLHLHVGLGTFLPISESNLDHHKMHDEEVFVPRDTWAQIQKTRQMGGRVWALGSTVTRALESAARGELSLSDEGYHGRTRLFLKPGSEFKVVDVLMTNFHQPKSTLLAMVMAFSEESTVKKIYQWAIERKFRLFSYGDLSVWM